MRLSLNYFCQVVKSLRNQTVHNIGVVFCSKVGGKLFTALALSLLLKNSSRNDFGVFALFQALVTTTATFLLNGFNFAFIRDVASLAASPDRDRRSIVNGALQTTIVIAVLSGAFSAWIATQGHGMFAQASLRQLTPYVFIGVLTTCLMNFSISYFQGVSRFYYSGFLSLSQAALLLVGCLLLATFNSVTLSSVLALIIALPVIPFLFFLYSQWGIGLFSRLDAKRVLTMLRDQKWYLFYSSLLVLSGRIDVFMMSHFFSLDEVAVYSVASKLYNIFLIGLYSIHTVALPKFSACSQRSQLKEMYLSSFRLTVPIALLSTVGVFFWGDGLIKIFAGDGYEASRLPLIVLGVSAGISLILSPSINILFALNEIKIIVFSSGLLLVSLLLGHYFLTQRFSTIGCALTTLMGFAIQNLFIFAFALRSERNEKSRVHRFLRTA